MKFLCECGYIIRDSTDYLSYKAHLISDQDYFDLLDEVDHAIEGSGPTPQDKEHALMKVRSLFQRLTKTIYQCKSCGNVYFNEEDKWVRLEPQPDDNKRRLLRSAKGDDWPGFLYGDWYDELPVWSEVKGSISAPLDNLSGSFKDWESLENEYYTLFADLKNRGLLRVGTLKKNGQTLHSWREEHNKHETLKETDSAETEALRALTQFEDAKRIEGGGSPKKVHFNLLPKPLRIFGYGAIAAVVGLLLFGIWTTFMN